MKKLRVLVGCEFSGIVRDAFKAKGHDAWSCDLLPTERSGQHIKGDVLGILDWGWDLMIAHPPCTHLCSSGARYWKEKQKDGRQHKAIKFFRQLYFCRVPFVCCENPVGILSTDWKKPNQYIQPYEYGDPYLKKTGLWLKCLPRLRPTNIVTPIAHWHGGCRRGGIKKDGTRTPCKLPTALKYGEKARSRTFQGIANAMAEQWG